MLIASLFDPLYQVVGYLLALLYIPLHNLGLSIIVMTLIVMAVQLPLIAKQTRSMILMQRVQPEIKKIQQQYKEDRQKQNEELLKFYQENKINPLAGCLPLLLILPIGIAVFGTFRHPGIQTHIPQGSGQTGDLYRALCTEGDQHAPIQVKVTTNGQPQTITKTLEPAGTVLPASTPTNSTQEDCTDHLGVYTPKAMHFLGLELNLSASRALKDDGLVSALPYLLMVALVVFSGWYQVRQTQARQLRQGGAPPNAQMQMVTRVMPVFFGVISFGFNAATTLYFIISNGWRIGQQHFVLNKMYEEEGLLNKDAGKSTSKPAPPPAAKPTTGAQPSGSNGSQDPNAAAARRRKKKRKR